jgi:hypothetical protein
MKPLLLFLCITAGTVVYLEGFGLSTAPPPWPVVGLVLFPLIIGLGLYEAASHIIELFTPEVK